MRRAQATGYGTALHSWASSRGEEKAPAQNQGGPLQNLVIRVRGEVAHRERETFAQR